MKKRSFGGIEQVQAPVDTAYPEISFFIDQQALDHIIAQAAGVPVGMYKGAKGFLLWIKEIDAAVFRAQPEIALPVFLHDPDGIGGGIARFGQELR